MDSNREGAMVSHNIIVEVCPLVRRGEWTRTGRGGEWTRTGRGAVVSHNIVVEVCPPCPVRCWSWRATAQRISR